MPGLEWLVDAHGCDPSALADLGALRRLFDRVVADLGLTPVGGARWHRFPDPGGITGLLLLAESHLTVHSWPEHGSLCLNLFCCRPRPLLDFEGVLRTTVGARQVDVRRVERRYDRTRAEQRRQGIVSGELVGLPGLEMPPEGATVTPPPA